MEDFRRAVYHHAYSLGCIEFYLALVLSGAASLRCASRVIEMVVIRLGVACGCPSWYAGRFWLLRVGYYKLMRPKTRAEDWVWIVDHTVQIGQEKCLVILGVRLSDLPLAGRCLSHEAVETIELLPVKQSNGDVVYQQLEKAAEKTGIPREIVSDHGRDLNAGVEKFCQHHPQTSPVYDIKHKTAAILKHELEQDADWHRFTQLANQTRRQVQQTGLAALAPPNQKTKARYMNVDELVTWGQTMLAFLNQPAAQLECSFDLEQVKEKLGWVTGFRVPLENWGELFEIIGAAESFVRQHGLYAGVHSKLEKRLQGLAHTPCSRRVRRELLDFVTGEEAQARPGERLLGSSEIIESVLGKLKRLEQDQAQSGFTGLILGLSAMVSTTTQAVIQKALETVSTQQVLAWCRETFGQSVQAKRREVVASLKGAEQKRDQALAVT